MTFGRRPPSEWRDHLKPESKPEQWSVTDEERDMIKDCETHSERMTDWELHFIDDISKYDVLSRLQHSKLETIWEKVTKLR